MTMGEDLLAIYQEDALVQRELATRTPAACPHDGTPLESGPRGELHCRHDGWVWDGTPVYSQPNS